MDTIDKTQAKPRAKNTKRVDYCNNLLFQKHLSKTGLCRQLGISRSTFYNFINGYHNNPQCLEFFDLKIQKKLHNCVKQLSNSLSNIQIK